MNQYSGHGEASRFRILDAMRDVHAATGFWPSVRELCAATGLRSTSTVGQHLRALERAGLVVQKGRGAPYAIPNDTTLRRGLTDHGAFVELHANHFAPLLRVVRAAKAEHVGRDNHAADMFREIEHRLQTTKHLVDERERVLSETAP